MSDTFMSGQAPQTSGATGPAGGDLSGTYPNPAISTGKIQRGQTGAISVAAGGTSPQTVTFNPAFAAVPFIAVAPVATLADPGANPISVCLYGPPSTTGFGLEIHNSGAAAVTIAVDWIAVE